MGLQTLETSRLDDFIAFCQKHKAELDDSFLYDEDLAQFRVGAENPTYVVTNAQGEVIAAASLMLDAYGLRGRKARFRIFHSEIDDKDIYQQLLDSILQHVEKVDKVFVFVPVVNEGFIQHLHELAFTVERYSFLLVREEPKVNDFQLPEGFQLRPFRLGDEEDWCTVRNAAFATVRGNETPISPEMVTKLTLEADYLDGGMMLLYHEGKVVGAVRGADDEYENEPILNIGPIAVLPEYQGKGLGRVLLRAALKFAKEKGYKRTVLSVNADNERAKSLYLQEGFKQAEAVVCLERACR